MNIRKNLTLWLGITIPILMVVAVAASVYVPRLWASPKVDFVYSMMSYSSTYKTTADGKMTEKNLTTVYYLHNTAKNTNREIKKVELDKLSLNKSAVSPDGFRVTGNETSNALFGDSEYGVHYLKGHGAGYKLNLASPTSDRYGYEFKFVGWVK